MTRRSFRTATLTALLCLLPAVAPAAGGMSTEVVISELDNQQYQPAVAYNWKHQEYLVVWHNTWAGGGRDVYAQRIDAWGRLLSWFTVTTSSVDRAQPSAAYDPVNDRYLVVFVNDAFGNGSDWDVWGRLVPWNGPSTALAAFPICSTTSSQWSPKVAYAGTAKEFMVVWTNTPASGPAWVSGRRVSDAGALLGSEVVVASAGSPRLNPDIAYNQARNEYLVTYDAYGSDVDVAATRLTAAGLVLSEIPVAGWPQDEEHTAVAACSGSDRYLVAWQSHVAADTNVYVRFVSGSGAVDGAPIELGGTTANEAEPAVACREAEGSFLVTWEQQYSSLTGPYGVSGRTVGGDKALGASYTVRAPHLGEDVDSRQPAVTAGKLGWLVVWRHRRNGASYEDVHARFVWSLFADGFESGGLAGWSSSKQ